MKPSIVFKSLIVLCVLGCFIAMANQGTSKMPLVASDDFEAGRTERWQPNNTEHWRVVRYEGSMVYELISPGQQAKVRAPTSWSLLAGHDVESFIFTGRLKCNADTANPKRDICIFFHFQNPTHFYYVHFSASSDEVHNIIALVNGADRVKINSEPPGRSVFRLTDKKWHRFKVICDATTGEIEAFLDDMKTPILKAYDNTLNHGLVGIGSFDDTGYFDDITLWGEKYKGR